MGIGEVILSGVISLVALCSGAAIWEVAKEEKQNRIFATQLWEGITEPSPWENPISPVAKNHLTGFQSEKQLRYPVEKADELPTVQQVDNSYQSEFTEPNPWGQSRVTTQTQETTKDVSEYSNFAINAAESMLAGWDAATELQCISLGVTISEYNDICRGWPESMPIPSPAQVAIMLGRQPALTPPQTDEGTQLGTEMPTRETHESIERMGVSADSRNLSDDLSGDISETFPKVSAGLSEREALQLEREIKAFAPYPIDANDSDSLFAVESALRLEKSKAWMCKELFGGIKPGGNKEYQEFQKLVGKANG